MGCIMKLNYLPNIGYITDDVPKEIMQVLAKEVDKIITDPSSATPNTQYLSSNFDAYVLKDSIPMLEPYIIQLAQAYDKEWPYYTLWQLNGINRPVNIQLNDLWVNIQTPGSFNPNHRHLGLYSFVIWMLIPFDYEEQQANKPGAPVKGCFEFSYTSITGEVLHEIIPADRSYHGKIALFPSNLQHGVYPFHHDDPKAKRITVSGNLRPVV